MAIEIPALDVNVALQLIIVFGWAVALLVVDLFIPAGQKRVTGYLALLGLLVAAGAGVPLWGQRVTSFAGMLTLDPYALLFNWIFLGVGALAVLLALDYLPKHGLERGEYYVLLLLAVGGMIALAQGNDLIVVFLGLELLSLTLYVLTAFAYPQYPSEEAGLKYLLYGAFAAGFLVFAIALIFGATGSSNLTQIAAVLAKGGLSGEDRILVLIGTALLIVGLGYKIAMAPFHMWTPDVYEGAPTAVTAFMSVGTKAAAFAALLRVLAVGLPSIADVWVPALAALAALTMLIGNIGALVQTNLKRLLAYSSIGQAGYILMGVVAAAYPASAERGVNGVIFYFVGYAFANLAAFAVLIALEERGAPAVTVNDLSGLFGRHPWLAGALTLALLSLAGVPPLAGFVAKLYVFTAAWQAGLGWLVVVGVIASAIAAFFYLRPVAAMFMGRADRPLTPDLGRNTLAVLALGSIGVVLIGLIPTPVLTLVEQTALALGR